MPNSIHSNEYRNVIRQLREARNASRLTQFDVSQKIKKPQSYISKIERGERRVDVIELITLARIYKKTLNYFVK